MDTIWNKVLLDNSVKQWAIAIGIMIVGFIAIAVFKKIIFKQLKRWAIKSKTSIDDFLIIVAEKFVFPLLNVGAVYLGFESLTFGTKVNNVIHIAIMVIATFFILRIVTAVIREFVFGFIRKQENSESKEKQARGLIVIVNVVIWVVGFIFMIDNLGYDVSTLIAGMGIGGIAIALAAQTILGDLFSYFVIFFDRPFEIGDFIIVDDKMGTVEYIGIKTTRLRTLSGDQLVCSNKDLTNSRVHNYKRMDKRRIVFSLGVTYQTTYDQLKRIPEIVKNIMQVKEGVEVERGHFSGFGASSLNFEFVYYVSTGDYTVYMDKQQAIYLDIVQAFEKEGIDFAYPTQTLFINRDPAEQKELDK